MPPEIQSPPAEPEVPASGDMANYELDPVPWLPWGHQIIDGGPTRLPCTYYFPAHEPPRLHENYCVAILEPEQPLEEEDHRRDQVRDFLNGPLNRNIIDYQPCLFGIGLYQLRNAHARQTLVQHGPYQMKPNLSVRFVNHDEGDHHRVVLGFRRGWIMFIGIPSDYRNDIDIANAMASFGQFHH